MRRKKVISLLTYLNALGREISFYSLMRILNYSSIRSSIILKLLVHQCSNFSSLENGGFVLIIFGKRIRNFNSRFANYKFRS